MKKLTKLGSTVVWLKANTQGTLQTDSRRVAKGDAFLAWPGTATDARQYIAQALTRGASVCLIEAKDVDQYQHEPWFNNENIATLPNLKEATGTIADVFFNHPSAHLQVIAVTGTNGKTSTAWWLASALPLLKQTPALRCAVVGTLGIGEPPDVRVNGLTTPDPVLLQASLRTMVDQGIGLCAMEASSIGIAEQRLSGTRIQTAIFTNFTQDHLDYHADMDAYWACKRSLFNWPGLAHAVVNIDDAKGQELAHELGDSAIDVWTLSTHQSARLQASAILPSPRGVRFEVIEQVPGQTATPGVRFDCPVVGVFNVMNVLGVVAALRCQGFDLMAIAEVCAQLAAVPGRMERIHYPGLPTVVVDYAHSPDALTKALQALRPTTSATNSQLWCVFGCGGNRDASKRPLMAKAVEALADQIMVTSDNPRDEDPHTIIQDVQRGFSQGARYMTEVDRRQALWHCIRTAAPDDVILVAGKGHEPYQEVNGVKLAYSDITTVKGICQALSQSMLNLDQMQLPLGALAVHGSANTAFAGVSTDTRTTAPGDLFVALRGETFDGHSFVGQAVAKGAVAAVVDRYVPDALVAQLVVDDTKLALGQLAAHWRGRFTLPLIAVTGSNGKTTVTQMLATILRHVFQDGALATQGNLNNDIGLPLTLLGLRSQHQVAVVEMGMNHPGEIAYLAGIAQPTVALVNNAQREHLEFMGSIDQVARENGSVLPSIAETGTAVFPADDPYSQLWREMAHPRKVLTFGMTEVADVFAISTLWRDGAWQVSARTPQGDCVFSLAVAGRHNVKNALAALACAIATGLTPSQAAEGLSRFVPVKGRSRSMALQCNGSPLTLVDDTYNANPDSMKAAVDVLADLPQPSLLVVGDMGEVGSQGPAFHFELGQYAKTRSIDTLLATGAMAHEVVRGFEGGQCIANRQDLIDRVIAQLPSHASVLVKGSRFMKMEQVVEAIVQNAPIAKGDSHAA